MTFWGGTVARIELDPQQFDATALAGLMDFSHLEILYFFNNVNPASIVTAAEHPRENPAWPKVGIFAQRKKSRPNRLGLSTCRLLAVDGLAISVAELDAIDGTPVIDIKPYVLEFAAAPRRRAPAKLDQRVDEGLFCEANVRRRRRRLKQSRTGTKFRRLATLAIRRRFFELGA